MRAPEPEHAQHILAEALAPRGRALTWINDHAPRALTLDH
jgi:hypothetical protein